MQFMIKNARKNSQKGISAEKVVQTILKADRAVNPKLSYTVGKDAYLAKIFSKLPQKIINKGIKFGLKSRMKHL